MIETRLILHVKGTESDTTVLPTEVVKAAISQGQITDSQLIWSPTENAWKQVREIPHLAPEERLTLHVKGTEAETTQIPKKEVRAAIAQGQITHSQLIWIPNQNTWKQVREMPDLLPSQKLAPAPVRTVTPEAAVPVVLESPTSPVARVAVKAFQDTPSEPVPAVAAATTPQPRVAVKVSVAGATPTVKTASSATPAVRVAAAGTAPKVKANTPILVRSTGSLEVREHSESNPLKWVCIGLGLAIALVIGANYFLVDQPLASSVGQTPYRDATVYAHLGGFVQPNVMVVHLPPSAAITPGNLTDFLAELAHGSPQNPWSQDSFDRVALTAGWTARYSISGSGWKQLGDLHHGNKDQQKEVLLQQLTDAAGQPLLPPSTMNQAAQEKRRERAWQDFVNYFTPKP